MSPSCARVCQNRGIGSNTGKDYRVELVSHFVQSLEAFSKIAQCFTLSEPLLYNPALYFSQNWCTLPAQNV